MNLPDLASVTLRKVTLRLIPFLFVLYIVAWLDRVNVGFAGLQMNSDLGFSSAAVWFRFRRVLPRLLPVRSP